MQKALPVREGFLVNAIVIFLFLIFQSVRGSPEYCAAACNLKGGDGGLLISSSPGEWKNLFC